MHDTDTLSAVASLLGEPARTRMLTALLGGGALTAKELAYFARVTPPTASSHLSRLVAGDLLVMEQQGRWHYYRLKSAEVAAAIEGLMGGSLRAGRSRHRRRLVGSRSCQRYRPPVVAIAVGLQRGTAAGERWRADSVPAAVER
jgi:DNA-binding transcriptional ArsR family regulator